MAKASTKNTKKNTPAKKPAASKRAVKKATEEVIQDEQEKVQSDAPAETEAVANETEALPGRKDPRIAKLITKFPQLTEADFLLYEGETWESLRGRLSQKLGVSTEDIILAEW